MSGRPFRIPNYATTWATAGNYPGGIFPWSAQPMLVAPVTSYFSPGNPVPAENVNYLLNATFTELGALNTFAQASFDFLSTNYIQNWPELLPIAAMTGSGTAIAFGMVAWDVVAGRWIAMGTISGSSTIVTNVSIDNGATWNVTTLGPFASGGGGGVATNVTAILVIVSSGVICAFCKGQSSVVNTNPGNSTTWSTHPTGIVAGGTVTTAIRSGGTYIGIGASATPKTWIVTSSDGITWTDRSAQVPVALASLNVSYLSALDLTGDVIVIPVSATVRTGMVSTNNGVTWASMSFVNGSLSAGDTPSALAFGTYDNKLMLALTNTSYTRIMTSSDGGATWTYVRQITGYTIASLTVQGTVWLALAGLGGGSAANTLIYSLDAGVTWALMNFKLPPDVYLQCQAIVGNESQFCAVNSVAAYFSHVAGSNGTF